MIFEKLKSLIAEQFNVDEDSITMETSFADDLNADSVDLVDLSMALEEEFGIDELTEEETASISTVGDILTGWSASCRAKWTEHTERNTCEAPPRAEFCHV